jgi:release factor glutamine methyltransferase
MIPGGRVDEALQFARVLGLDRLDALLLLAHRVGRSRAWLLAHGDHSLSFAERDAFETDCRRRLDGLPVAYLLGVREFRGLRLRVTPDVLVPRPETEGLVDWALEWLNDGPLSRLPAPRVLDLGTGSGAVALAVAQACPRARVTATDCSEAALDVAQDNAARLGIDLEWHLGDWWQAVGAMRFDLVLSNPPYVAVADPHLAALRHEPVQALESGSDGLDDLRRIIDRAMAHVDGWLIVEHGWNQAAPVAALMRSAGADDVQMRADLAGHPRHTGGRWAP